jgi:hypothetical protein
VLKNVGSQKWSASAESILIFLSFCSIGLLSIVLWCFSSHNTWPDLTLGISLLFVRMKEHLNGSHYRNRDAVVEVCTMLRIMLQEVAYGGL